MLFCSIEYRSFLGILYEVTLLYMTMNASKDFKTSHFSLGHKNDACCLQNQNNDFFLRICI